MWMWGGDCDGRVLRPVARVRAAGRGQQRRFVGQTRLPGTLKANQLEFTTRSCCRSQTPRSFMRACDVTERAARGRRDAIRGRNHVQRQGVRFLKAPYTAHRRSPSPLELASRVRAICRGSRYRDEHVTTQAILYEAPAAHCGHFLTPEPLPMGSDGTLTMQVQAALATCALVGGITVGYMFTNRGEQDESPASAAGDKDITGLNRNVQQINSAWVMSAMLAYALAHPSATLTSCAMLSPVRNDCASSLDTR
jgi:hypothetical protein